MTDITLEQRAAFDSWWHKKSPELVSGDWDDDRAIAQAAWEAALRLSAGANAVEQLDESEKDVALGQAVEFAEYVERQAKGAMRDAAKRFLSLPYALEIAARLDAAHIANPCAAIAAAEGGATRSA